MPSRDHCITADGDSHIRRREVLATLAENELRRKIPRPERTHYDKNPLPSGDCQPQSTKPPPRPLADRLCPATGCGGSNGDPHLTTFDGLHYDFQAAGEFTLTRDRTTPGFAVQSRQQPYAGSRTVAVNTAIAADVASDRVEVGLERGRLTMAVNGKSAPPVAGPLPHGGQIGVEAQKPDTAVTLHWPDGSVTTIATVGRWGLRVTVRPAPTHAGHLEGLLGDMNGDQADDLRTPGGSPLGRPTFDTLYPAYADSWRVDPASSLFTYPAGAGPQTYTDRTRPDRPATNANPSAAATALCRQFGVTDPDALHACELDITATGQTDFATAALADQPVPGQPADPAKQAKAVDDLLNRSADSRRGLAPALTAADRCRDLAGTLDTIHHLADARTEQLATAHNLDIDALPDAAHLKDLLIQALSRSLEADQAYHRWVTSLKNDGCTPPARHTADWTTASDLSQRATAAKTALINAWNPIATTYRLPARHETDL